MRLAGTLVLLSLVGHAALAQRIKNEIVNAAPTPAGDSKANSDQVPDVYSISGRFERVVTLRFKYQADLLAGLEKMVKQEKIRNAVILSAFGSVRNYHVHVVSNRTFPYEISAVGPPTSRRLAAALIPPPAPR